jgi:ABC-2 type transport system ATP-binding protein
VDAASSHVVEARALEKSFGRVRALHDINLAIPHGAIYGVLGPSGAGKTTLVKCIGLVSRPTGGSLRLFGKAIKGRPGAVRSRIGYMPQQAALYEELSARFNVRFFSRGASAARIDQLLDFLDLADRANDQVFEFSGGMKQRVSLACALANEPELLLLDEPTAGIDPVLRIRFWEEFRRLRDAGHTLLVSTHQIDEAVHCDRLLVIREGLVLVESPPQELLASGGAVVTLDLENGDTVEERLADPEHQLPGWLAERGLAGVESLRLRQDSLEDILVKLIREAEDE